MIFDCLNIFYKNVESFFEQKKKAIENGKTF